MIFDDITYEKLNNLSKEYGDSFYLLDSKLFEDNYKRMLESFRKFYTNTSIAYSYKTNYLPVLVKIINKNGGYAEIVSDMEWWLTKELGIDQGKVYFNGPYKKKEIIEEFLLSGGHLNIDAEYEADIVKDIAIKYPSKKFEVGLRCNVDICQNEPSRFGLDVEGGLLYAVYEELNKIDNISVVGLHLHLPFRNIDTFKDRMIALAKILEGFSSSKFKYISMGGGYMGAVDPELAAEFSFVPPTYDDYAKVVAGEFNHIFKDSKNKPELIIEPGSALVANSMRLVTKVVNIKKSRDKYIATLSGSTYNMNPSVKGVRRNIDVYSNVDKKYDDTYENLDMAGYTCIEGDYLYKGYNGRLSKDDYVVFRNVGSYSIVMKPPFILPDIAAIDISNDRLVKKLQPNSEIYKLMI